jgi:tetratricopeptide (TPR) repeat protein
MRKAEDVMRRRYPSYHAPFEVARAWLREGGPCQTDALDVLTWLRERYAHVLSIGNELVLALMEKGRTAEALAELARLGRQFPEVDEETRCRWGRVYKQEGDRAWHAADLVTAEGRYHQALEQYDIGYGLRQGHYPGINQATLLLLLAAVARQRNEDGRSIDYLRRAEAVADDVVARRDRWSKDLPDDNIWHPATAGEASLLKRRWADAAGHYHAALAERGVQPFHRHTIGKQARRILRAWSLLDVRPEPPFDPDALFGPPPASTRVPTSSQPLERD